MLIWPHGMTKAFALMYHDVVVQNRFGESGIQGPDADIYKIDESEFELHLDALQKLASARVKTCLDETLGDSPVFLTFDDGGVCSLWVARRLEDRSWRGHFFITTDWIGKKGFAGKQDLQQMAANGHVIGSHSCSHPLRISELGADRIRNEWQDSVKILSEVVGKPVTVASVPGGFYSRQVGELAAEAGIKILFTSEPTAVPRQIGAVLTLGRYYLQQGMGPEKAVSFAGGPGTARLMQAINWGLKKAAKRVGGEMYAKFRRHYRQRHAGTNSA
jgi:peptidoglycan/xylan/chitin deacetylase (PgdA/CDA1 family)